MNIRAAAGAMVRRMAGAWLLLCAVCLVQQVQAAEPDYLTLTNTSGSSAKVNFRRTSAGNNSNTVNIEWSVNGGEWTAREHNYDTYAEIIVPAGQSVRFRGSNIVTDGGVTKCKFNGSKSIYWFIYSTEGKFKASGNVMSIAAYDAVNDVIHSEYPLADYCFYSLFYYGSNSGFTTLVDASELLLPSTQLGQYCYGNMFCQASALIGTPVLPATILAQYCYSGMFQSCRSLTVAPELSATTLANYCYNMMFYGCTSLTTAPYLGVTTLTEGCYQSMFKDCTSLVNVQAELPGTNLPAKCYYEMFSGCTALKTAPEILAPEDAVVGQGACYNMFTSCTSLTQAPSVLRPRTLNVNQVYYNMFLYCSSLQRGPDVWATTIGSGKTALFGLYQHATSLTHIRVHFKAWGSMSFCNQWSVGLPQKGAFYCPPELERNFTNSSWNHIPYSPDYPWTVFSYNLTYIPVGGEWPMGGTDHVQYTWETDTNYVQGWMRDLDVYSAEYYHDAACTQPFPEEEIIAFLATQQESSSDITKNIYVKLGAVAKMKITFIDDDYNGNKELAVIEVAKGTVPEYPNATPVQYAVGDKIYYFTGWTPAIVAATEDATYKAVYSDSPRYEFVSYKLEDEDKNEFECTPAAKPVVLTNDATSVTSDGAVLNGLVSSDGGLTVTERGFCWGTASDNLANCTASGSGTGAFTYTLSGLTASTTYYFQAYATNSTGTARGEVKSFTTEAPAGPTGSNCDHEWVQLWAGGPKWATVNIGASSETEAGNYYMWGDTNAGATCLWSNYTYKGSNKNTAPYTKYGAAKDGLLELEAGDDAATQAWGCGWRTPTKAEMDDLKVYCNVAYDATKKGVRYTSKTTGQSIFLLTTGYKGNGSNNGTTIFNEGKYAKYITATSDNSSTSSSDCYYLYWYTNTGQTALSYGPQTSKGERCIGMSVRAVCD